VYDRRLGSRTLTLGHTGRLLENAFVLYDRDSGAQFCQASGRCVLGSDKERSLTPVASWILPWGVWRSLFPASRVMLAPQDSGFDYSRDVYADYHASDRIGIHALSRLDRRLPPKSLVMGVESGGSARCWTVRRLSKDLVVNDTVGTEPVVVAWDRPGRWGSCFNRSLEGRVHTFSQDPDGTLRDDTGGSWDLVGRGVSGHARGKQLRRLPARVTYWFSFQAHQPSTTVAE
jgi:hypothetical protein